MIDRVFVDMVKAFDHAKWSIVIVIVMVISPPNVLVVLNHNDVELHKLKMLDFFILTTYITPSIIF